MSLQGQSNVSLTEDAASISPSRNREHEYDSEYRRLMPDFMPQPSTPMTMFFPDQWQDGGFTKNRKKRKPEDMLTSPNAYDRYSIDEKAPDSGYETIQQSNSGPSTPASSRYFHSSDHGSSHHFRASFDHKPGSLPHIAYRNRVLIAVAVAAIFLIATYTALVGAGNLWMLPGNTMSWAWRTGKLVSCALEMVIELTGFLIGRTVARFGRGFVRGYNM